MIRIYPPVHTDRRGTLVKPVSRRFAESFYTSSSTNVLRGMHFDSRGIEKMVYCVAGKVFDVVLDLATGRYETCILKPNEGIMVPSGRAHGFLSLEPSIMLYYTTLEYDPEFDSGVMWNSFGCMWPTEYPVLSERDQKFPTFEELCEP